MAGEAIFVGYRRDDTADVAGRIYDAMAMRFGKGRVFKDVDNIGPGVHFGDYIKSVLPKCRVALMLIGPHWLESKDEDGRRRLDNEHDWVRIEIETALSTPDMLTVPVLVNGARMPRASDVPESLRPLLQRNAAIIRRDPDFHDDVERLATALRASVNTGILDLSKIGGQSSSAGSAPRARSMSRIPMMIAAALALVAAGYGAWRFLPGAFPPPPEQIVYEASESDPAQGASDPASSGSSVDARTAPSSTRAPVVRNPSSLPDFAMFRECDACPEMVILPRGNLLMGSPSSETERQEDEDSQAGAGGAQVNVTIQRFAIARFETTWDEWDACVAAGSCNQSAIDAHIQSWNNFIQSWNLTVDSGWGRGRRPVINVDWNDAGAYAAFVNGRSGGGYRRPTEAEWEYAARANTRTRFSWGDDDPTCDQQARNGANFSACTDDRTRPVGSFRANPWGLYDIHGNVWEWVEDCYRDSLAGQSSDGRAFQSSSCAALVQRGGSWNDSPQGLRSAFRFRYFPTSRGSYVGFRLARTI
jgi:formylglycine-generating enzyme required for sulfatase activity